WTVIVPFRVWSALFIGAEIAKVSLLSLATRIHQTPEERESLVFLSLEHRPIEVDFLQSCDEIVGELALLLADLGFDFVRVSIQRILVDRLSMYRQSPALEDFSQPLPSLQIDKGQNFHR